MIFTLGNNVYLQRLNGVTKCVIFVYAMPLAGTKTPNGLNASSTNYNCERVFASSGKLQLTRCIENAFTGTRMLVQAGDQKSLQRVITHKYHARYIKFAPAIVFNACNTMSSLKVTFWKLTNVFEGTKFVKLTKTV